MTNFSSVNCGTVKLKHHSTSSLVEIIVSHNDGEELIPESIMVDYNQWEELKRAIKMADEN